MDKYLWPLLAAICGGVVAQVGRNSPMTWKRRVMHIAAGAIISVYASPLIISYYKLALTDWQYLVSFAVGLFWLKLFEAADASISGIKFPWSK